MNSKIVVRSVAAGMLVTVAAAPYALAAGEPPNLAFVRLAFVLPISILLWQASFAWTGAFPRQLPPWGGVFWRNEAGIAAAAAVCALVFTAVLDPVLKQCVPSIFPQDLGAWIRGLLWATGFQNLVFDAGVFAFTVRLFHRPWVGAAAIVLIREAAVYWTLPPGTAPMDAAWILTGAGVVGAVHGVAYLRCGFLGAATVTLGLHLRLLW